MKVKKFTSFLVAVNCVWCKETFKRQTVWRAEFPHLALSGRSMFGVVGHHLCMGCAPDQNAAEQFFDGHYVVLAADMADEIPKRRDPADYEPEPVQEESGFTLMDKITRI